MTPPTPLERSRGAESDGVSCHPQLRRSRRHAPVKVAGNHKTFRCDIFSVRAPIDTILVSTDSERRDEENGTDIAARFWLEELRRSRRFPPPRHPLDAAVHGSVVPHRHHQYTQKVTGSKTPHPISRHRHRLPEFHLCRRGPPWESPIVHFPTFFPKID